MYEDLMKIRNDQPQFDRWIIHLVQRVQARRLSLILGAGASYDAKVPLWQSLVDGIAASIPEFSKSFGLHSKSNPHPAYLSQIVFHRFSDLHGSVDQDAIEYGKLDVADKWAESIRSQLYQKVPSKIEDVLKLHPYLRELASVAYKCSIVINFNFDDLLVESMRQVFEESKGTGSHRLPPQVIWQHDDVQRDNVTTVYHVNGLLPREKNKTRSERLVFTESSFADVLIDRESQFAESTMSHFLQNTLLLVGHSLEDASLKNILRACRQRRPANFHYFIYWVDAKKPSLSQDFRDDIFRANLEVYNLITIFMTTNQIKELCGLLAVTEESDIIEALNQIGITKQKYCYYVVGPVGAGKTTVLEGLRNFNTLEEWLGRTPGDMYKAHTDLTENEREAINGWIYSQLRMKNEKINLSGIGYHFMDRAPLDALAFSRNKAEKKKKARQIEEAFSGIDFVSGEVVFVEASLGDLVHRNLRRGRRFPKGNEERYLKKQRDDLKDVYDVGLQNRHSTSAKGTPEVSRDIAYKALMGDYEPVEFRNLLKSFTRKNGGKST